MIRLLCSLGIVTILAASASAGSDYSIPRHTIDGGGGVSSGGAFSVAGTIGQPDAGEMTGGTFALSGGFWSAGDGGPSCTGDVDGSGEVGFADLVDLLAAWGACGDPCPQDLDDSGDVGFGDLVLLLAAWGPCS